MTCIHIARSLQFSSGPATRWFLAFYCICKFRFQILRLCSNCESSFVLYHDSSRCKFSAKIEITHEYETSLNIFHHGAFVFQTICTRYLQCQEVEY